MSCHRRKIRISKYMVVWQQIQWFTYHALQDNISFRVTTSINNSRAIDEKDPLCESYILPHFSLSRNWCNLANLFKNMYISLLAWISNYDSTVHIDLSNNINNAPAESSQTKTHTGNQFRGCIKHLSIQARVSTKVHCTLHTIVIETFHPLDVPDRSYKCQGIICI